MGDFTEYWEDFPEDNPTNYIGGRYDPQGAAAIRANNAKVANEQANLDAEIRRIIQKAKVANKQAKLD